MAPLEARPHVAGRHRRPGRRVVCRPKRAGGAQERRRDEPRPRARHPPGRRRGPHLRDISLELAPGTLNVLLGPTLAGKTSLMRADGRARPADRGSRRASTGATSPACSVRQRNVAMVYQQFINYPSFTRLREHRLAAAHAWACRAPRSTDRCARTAAMLRIDALARPLAGQLSGGQQQRTAHRPRAGQGGRPRCCSTSRWSISTTSCARSCAPSSPRSSAAAGPIVVYATTEPAEALHPRRPHRGAGRGPRCCSSGRRVEVYPVAGDDRGGASLLRPADEPARGPGRGRPAFVLGERARVRRSRAISPASPDGAATGSASAPTICRLAPQGRRRHRASPAMVELAEISGSETFMHVDFAGASLGRAQAHGVHEHRARRSRSTLYRRSRRGSSSSTTAGRARRRRRDARLGRR